MQSETGNGRRLWILALLIALGAAVFIQGAARFPCISRDGVFFVEFAKEIRVDPAAAFARETKQPGYSILLLGLHSLMGRLISDRPAVSWEVCGQILAVIGGVSVIALVYLLARKLFDAETGIIAAALAAFWPQLVSLSSDVLSDAPHLALYLAGLLLALRAMVGSAHPTRWGTLIACGAVCGAAYWMRQEALGAMTAVVVCLLWPVEGVALRRRVTRAAVVVVAFVVVVAPYSLAVGKVMPNKSIRDLFMGPNSDEQTSQYDEKNSTVGADGPGFVSQISDLRLQKKDACDEWTVRTAGAVVWWDAPMKMLGGWSKSGRYVLSTLALVGFFWGRVPRSERTARRLVVVAALLQIVAAQARGVQYGVISDRYMLILAGLSIPWSAAGLIAAARHVGHRYGRQGLRPLLVAIAPMAYYDLAPAPAEAYWQREAGAWIAGHATAGDVVLAAPQLSPVSFYAGLNRSWPVGEKLARLWGSATAVWVVDYPEMHRMTEKERAMLDECRQRLGYGAQMRTWLTEENQIVGVYAMQGR